MISVFLPITVCVSVGLPLIPGRIIHLITIAFQSITHESIDKLLTCSFLEGVLVLKDQLSYLQPHFPDQSLSEDVLVLGGNP